MATTQTQHDHAPAAPRPTASAHDHHAAPTTTQAPPAPQHDHGAMDARRAPAAASVEVNAPRSNSAIAAVDPRATLRSDELDAPAHISVIEASKAQQAAPHQHKKDHR